MRVLLADDDPVARRLVTYALRRFGHEVTAVDSGSAAREMFLKEAYPLVITDWEMPGLDGLQLCRQIRAAGLPAYTYIIVLTAHSQRSEMIEGLAAGADEFVSKPFDPQELQVRLRSAERVLRLEADLGSTNEKLRQMNQHLHKMSRLDPLMEIGNRLAFEEEFCRFHQRAMSNQQAYGVVMCDIDHFKRCNDLYGHQQGDEILRQVAETIRALLRSGDAAFRFGGEEVLLLLPNQNLDGAGAAAERIRCEIERQEFGVGSLAEPIRVTISCGVASYPENYDRQFGWSGLLKAADQALYEAKDAGRNRVATAQPLRSEPPRPSVANEDAGTALAPESLAPDSGEGESNLPADPVTVVTG